MNIMVNFNNRNYKEHCLQAEILYRPPRPLARFALDQKEMCSREILHGHLCQVWFIFNDKLYRKNCPGEASGTWAARHFTKTDYL